MTDATIPWTERKARVGDAHALYAFAGDMHWLIYRTCAGTYKVQRGPEEWGMITVAHTPTFAEAKAEADRRLVAWTANASKTR